MVGSEAIGKGLGSTAGEAAQALTAILQTQYLRYIIIASWAVGLLGAVGWATALIWFVVTLGAGAVRGAFERRMADRMDIGWGLAFPAVATITTAAWAIAPLLAWFSPHVFGHTLAVALIIAGYVLVFAQLRSSPVQAIVVSSPYGVASLVILVNLWGTPSFWPFIAMIPFTVAGLFVLVMMTMLREKRLKAFQDHQAHLIAELQEARDKADAANQAKSSFLGVISHELRTPMNGVLGAAQLLSATRLETTQKDYLSIIRNSGDSLLGLLNDILDMTKIEAGKMQFDVVDVSLQDMHTRATGPFTAQAEAKNITFVSSFAGETPTVVRGDPLRVCQVIQNLLSNAIKFTEPGGRVDYTITSTRISDKRVAFEYRIKDSGSGIAPDDLERLFQPFTQVDASSTRRFGGTGLGLTIARRMANIMGGDITVTSELGEGSVFTFTVEAEVVEWSEIQAAQPIDAETADGRALKVLVVEDHPVNRMILEAWLGSAGHMTASAENGQIAVDVAAQQAFDLIIMDINMPVMDGLTATQLIRRAGVNTETPIAVLSASARIEDHEAGLDAGADAYLTKPIDFTALAALMNRVGEGRAAIQSGISGSRGMNDGRIVAAA
ncbi:ATP-binding protein [Brevundimonas sp.]|uniref:ATP-binding protein n=1 Tax=Brevundimonas sp. TaxID=1871086 RepID=UPI003BAD151E